MRFRAFTLFLGFFGALATAAEPALTNQKALCELLRKADEYSLARTVRDAKDAQPSVLLKYIQHLFQLSDTFEEKAKVLDAWAELHSQESADALQSIAQNEKIPPKVRQDAALAFGKVKGSEAAPMLLALYHSTPRVSDKMLLVDGLMKMGYHDAPKLFAEVADSVPVKDGRHVLMSAIETMEPPLAASLIRYLQRAARDRDDQSAFVHDKVAASKLWFKKTGDKAAKKQIIQMLEDPKYAPVSSVRALIELGETDYLKSFRTKLASRPKSSKDFINEDRDEALKLIDGIDISSEKKEKVTVTPTSKKNITDSATKPAFEGQINQEELIKNCTPQWLQKKSNYVNLELNFGRPAVQQLGGTCHLFSTAALLEEACYRKTGKFVDISEAYAIYRHIKKRMGARSSYPLSEYTERRTGYFISPDIDGGYPWESIETLLDGHICSEAELPLSQTFADSMRLPFDKSAHDAEDKSRPQAAGPMLPREICEIWDGEIRCSLGTDSFKTQDKDILACLAAKPKRVKGTSMSWDEAKRLLDEGVPVFCGTRIVTSRGLEMHDLIIKGYELSVSGKRTLLLRDSDGPSDDRYMEVRSSAVCEFYEYFK